MISVIIVNYRCAALSHQAIKSVLIQEQAHEIILVDNSADAEEAERLRQGLPDPVQLIINSSNTGFARACNLAYAQCQGEHILLLNPDAQLFPGCLNRLSLSLGQDPRIAAVGPKTYWDQDKRYLLPPSIHPGPEQLLWHSLSQRYPRIRQLYSQHFRAHALRLWQAQRPLQVPALSGGLALLRREALERVGGLFDPGFFMYYEDSDLFWRLRQAGYRLEYEPRAEASHRYEHHPGKLALMDEAAPRYFSKHFAHSMLSRLAQWLSRPAPDSELPHTQDLGTLQRPPSWPVSPELQSG
ncbi:MAG: glycosyltransferase family 2 protein, partial [Gammaproteobacteria bacterium]|nr:glycosyltransferase family 2 protein [Gammaproteobacteria bacterium]